MAQLSSFHQMQTEGRAACSGAKHAMLWLEPVMSHLDKHLEALRTFLLGTAETGAQLIKNAHHMYRALVPFVLLQSTLCRVSRFVSDPALVISIVLPRPHVQLHHFPRIVCAQLGCGS